MAKALILDLDGTLADTLPVAIAAFQHTFRKHTGRDFAPDEIRAMFGPTEEGILRKQDPNAFDALFRTYLDEYDRRHDACPAPFPGLHELLGELAARDVRLGVVTGKGPASTKISLARLGLAELLSDVETGGDDGNVKPTGIRRLLDKWQVAAADAAYVGDHPSDITSARACGLTAIGAGWSPGTDLEGLRAEAPDHLFESIADLAGWCRARYASSD